MPVAGQPAGQVADVVLAPAAGRQHAVRSTARRPSSPFRRVVPPVQPPFHPGQESDQPRQPRVLPIPRPEPAAVLVRHARHVRRIQKLRQVLGLAATAPVNRCRAMRCRSITRHSARPRVRYAVACPPRQCRSGRSTSPCGTPAGRGTRPRGGRVPRTATASIVRTSERSSDCSASGTASCSGSMSVSSATAMKLWSRPCGPTSSPAAIARGTGKPASRPTRGVPTPASRATRPCVETARPAGRAGAGSTKCRFRIDDELPPSGASASSGRSTGPAS